MTSTRGELPGTEDELTPTAGLIALPELDRRIVRLLSDSPDSSSKDIAHEVWLSTAAVRHHLRRLESQGLVRRKAERRLTRGRPLYRFSLTPAAEELLPHGHGESLLSVLAVLEEDHPAVYEDVLQKLHRRRAKSGLDPGALLGWPVRERTNELRRWIHSYGHRTNFVVDPEGAELTVSHCSILDVARMHPRVCSAEVETLTTVFPEFDVSLQATRANGAGRCIFRLRATAQGTSL